MDREKVVGRQARSQLSTERLPEPKPCAETLPVCLCLLLIFLHGLFECAYRLVIHAWLDSGSMVGGVFPLSVHTMLQGWETHRREDRFRKYILSNYSYLAIHTPFLRSEICLVFLSTRLVAMCKCCVSSVWLRRGPTGRASPCRLPLLPHKDPADVERVILSTKLLYTHVQHGQVCMPCPCPR